MVSISDRSFVSVSKQAHVCRPTAGQSSHTCVLRPRVRVFYDDPEQKRRLEKEFKYACVCVCLYSVCVCVCVCCFLESTVRAIVSMCGSVNVRMCRRGSGVVVHLETGSDPDPVQAHVGLRRNSI